LWLLEELGCEYHHVPTDYSGGSRQADYLRLNPNGRVPCIVDGELVLFESLAINLYLARRHSSPLWPNAIEDEARMLQWTFWATNELDAHLSLMSRQQRLPEAARDAAAIHAAAESLLAPMRVLDAQLSDSQTLLRSEFSLADLNVASVVATALTGGYDLRPFAHVNAWLRHCLERPAAQRSVALVVAAAQR
jgi:glutathione S-transferase